MEMCLGFLYIILGYWSTGVTIYANKIVIHAFGQLFFQRLVLGIMFGWILIPIALVKKIIVIVLTGGRG